MSKKKASAEKTELAVLHHPHEGCMSVIVLERDGKGKVKCTPEADDAGFPKRNDKHEHDGTFEDEAWFDENLLEAIGKK